MIARLARIVAAAVLVTVAAAAPASAHTRLTGTAPKAGSTVQDSPDQIVLTFADAVILPKVVLTDAAGRPEGDGSPLAKENKVILAVKGTLKGGVHHVSWRAVSPDGHPIEGTFAFTVKGADGAQAAVLADSDDGTPVWVWGVLGAVALVLVAGGIRWATRAQD